MRRSVALGLAFLCLGLMVAALELQAGPPANDQCSGAEIIPGAGPFPYLSSIITNIQDATTVNDPPPPTNCYAGEIARSVWYRFAPTQSGLYTVTLKFTATTLQDTLLGIYTSAGGCGGPFVQYACNDDSGTLQSAITTNFNAGSTYYVVVWNTITNLPPEGQRSVQLKVQKVLPAPNDLCSGAEVIPSAGPFPYRTATTDTYLASTNNDPPGPLCGTSDTSPQRSVWYKFRPTVGGNYIIATCADTTATKIYNTMLGVYQSSGGCSGTLTPLRCNPGYCGNLAAVIMNLFPDTDYYFVVWDLASKGDPTPLPGETDAQLFIDQQGPPTVVTVGYSNAVPTSVQLNGEANPKGSLTRGYFEWGTTPSYGNVTANSTLGTGIVPFAYSRVVSGPPPGTTIYYRAAAVNFFGTIYGEGKSVRLPLALTATREGNTLRLHFSAAEEYTYVIEASEDLQHWTTLGPATPVDVDQFDYVDQGPLNLRQRFYRIKL